MLNAGCPYCRQDTAGNHEEGCPNNPDQSKLNYKLWEPAVEDEALGIVKKANKEH